MNSILNWLFRIVLAMLLLCVAAFCVFGFLASFEPGNGVQWKVGYGALACGGWVGAVALLVRARARILAALALFAATLLCVLGFLESYDSWPGQVVYAALGCCCLTGGVALLGPRGKRERPDNGSGLTHGGT
jgi:peptidoglycan/LPS O-acetylase OafA/YrhL